MTATDSPDHASMSPGAVLWSLLHNGADPEGRWTAESGRYYERVARDFLASTGQVTSPGIHVQATRYTVCCLPEDHIDRTAFEVSVEYRGHNRWAVSRHSQCLASDGTWSYEALPSGRTDEWLDEHRFTEAEALRLAQEWAPRVKCNGITVTEALERSG